MSRLWPHPAYAEDQPHAHAILTTHVLARGFTTGAILGASYTTIRHLIPSKPSSKATSAAASTAPSAPLPRPSFPTRLVLNSAKGALWTTPLMGLALLGRMQGREHIEWADRSWRLLENEGQLETDDWTLAGTVLGPGVWAAMGGGRGMSGARMAMGVTGAAALGGIAGTGGYMLWRYGVHGGKFPERKSV